MPSICDERTASFRTEAYRNSDAEGLIGLLQNVLQSAHANLWIRRNEGSDGFPLKSGILSLRNS